MNFASMNMTAKIRQIEDFVRPMMTAVIAHDFKHVDRVRRWAIRIAEAEGYPNLEIVQAATLLHDIGLIKDAGRRHAEIGAEMADLFLKGQCLFATDQIDEIVSAIRDHSSLNGKGKLYEILQDADGLELFGAVGILRAISSKGTQTDYEEGNVKGTTWEMSSTGFTKRFQSGAGIGKNITDQLNFQISCYENLHTKSAKEIAMPMVTYMREFLIRLDAEVSWL